jgi:NADH dehydrogenase
MASAAEPQASAPQQKGLHQVVVVGGGAGGLELVTKLGEKLGSRKKAEITLVDCSRIHIWKPLLHEVAAGSFDIAFHAVDYLAHAHQHFYRYRIGEMIGLDRSLRLVQLAATLDADGVEVTPPQKVRYDTLIIAIGSRTNDFGTPGVSEFAISLDTQEEAVRFHQKLINGLIRAQTQPRPLQPGQLHVAIIGAGATGTELAAELHQTTREVVAYGLDNIDPDKDLKITLVEAADRILPAVPERVAEGALRLLEGLKINVLTKTLVSEVDKDGVRTADGRFLPAELVVWSAGVKGPNVVRNLDGLEVSRSDQLVVIPTLQTTKDPNIFAMGDCAYLIQPKTGQPVPPRAQAAHQQAAHLVRQIKRLLQGKSLEPYVYRDFGSLVSLGKYSTVGSLMGFIVGKGFFIEGYFAGFMYRLLYKMHELTLHGPLGVVLDTISRLLIKRTEPRVKLH